VVTWGLNLYKSDDELEGFWRGYTGGPVQKKAVLYKLMRRLLAEDANSVLSTSDVHWERVMSKSLGISQQKKDQVGKLPLTGPHKVRTRLRLQGSPRAT
jgi:hypothetical protein